MSWAPRMSVPTHVAGALGDWSPPGTRAQVGLCEPCSKGKACSCSTPCNCKKVSVAGLEVVVGGWAPRVFAQVGRSMPNSEIAEHEKSVQQLDKDVAAHDPGPGDTLDLANWAAINHMMNGYLLRWGQWKTAMASDWWWGDDDEASFATLKAEYNQIRDKLLEYTKGKTTAPAAEVVSAAVVEQEKKDAEKGGVGQQFLDVAKTILYVGAAGLAAYLILPVLLPKLLSSGAGAASSGAKAVSAPFTAQGTSVTKVSG